MFGTLQDRHHAGQQGGNAEEGSSPALKELTAWREPNKQKAVTRGCTSAGLRLPTHRVPWEPRGKTSTEDQGRLLRGGDLQMGI